MLLMGLSRGPSPTPETNNSPYKPLDFGIQQTTHRPLSAPPENFALSTTPLSPLLCLSPLLHATTTKRTLPELQILNSFHNAADGTTLGGVHPRNSRKDMLSVLTDSTETTSAAQTQAGDDDNSSDSSQSQNMDTLNSKKRRHRTSTEQRLQLEKIFTITTTPSLTLREQLASQLGMSPRRIQVWFQNKRAKLKRSQNSAYGRVSLSPSSNAQSQQSLPTGTGALAQQALTQQVLPQFQQSFTLTELNGVSQPLQTLQQQLPQGLQQLTPLSPQLLHLSPQLGQNVSPTAQTQLSRQLLTQLSPQLSPNGQPQQLLPLTSGQLSGSLIAPLGLPIQPQLPPLNTPIVSSPQQAVGTSLPLPSITGTEKL